MGNDGNCNKSRLSLDGSLALDHRGRIGNTGSGIFRSTEAGDLLLSNRMGSKGWVFLRGDGRVGHVSLDGSVHLTEANVGTDFTGICCVNACKWIILYGGGHSGGRLLCVHASTGSQAWKHSLQYGEMLSASPSANGEAWLFATNVYHSFPIGIMTGQLIAFHVMPDQNVGGKYISIGDSAHSAVSSLAWSPDDHEQVFGGFDGELTWRRLKQPRHFAEEQICHCPGHDTSIAHVCVTGDGKGVVSVGNDGLLKIRFIQRGSEPGLPLMYATALPSLPLDIICPPGSDAVVLVDSDGAFRRLQIEGLWSQDPVSEVEGRSRHDRWIASGERVYTQVVGKLEHVVGSIASALSKVDGADDNAKTNSGSKPQSMIAENAPAETAPPATTKDLHTALETQDMNSFKALLEQGANVDELSEGWTPLMLASANNNLAALRLLIQRGADVNKKGRDGWTPLRWAAIYGHVDMIKELLSCGADPNPREGGGAHYSGMTPLLIACVEGRTEAVRVLIERGADVNAKSDMGLTPALLAAHQGHQEIAELLLEMGAGLSDSEIARLRKASKRDK